MMTLLADPEVTEIPAIDNGELLVDVATLGLLHSGSTSGGRRVRAGVAHRLVAADAALPAGFRLLIVEGHRSAREQERIIETYSASLRLEHPHLDELSLHRLSSRYVAPLGVAPHVAGAAVDLTLGDADGIELWMGTPIDATPEESDGACMFDATNIDAIARSRRALLAAVLTGAGLVNYPTEWWHWSFGDRYWAFVTGAGNAVYGPVDEAAA